MRAKTSKTGYGKGRENLQLLPWDEQSYNEACSSGLANLSVSIMQLIRLLHPVQLHLCFQLWPLLHRDWKPNWHQKTDRTDFVGTTNIDKAAQKLVQNSISEMGEPKTERFIKNWAVLLKTERYFQFIEWVFWFLFRFSLSYFSDLRNIQSI
jgi:hypothetical protein